VVLDTAWLQLPMVLLFIYIDTVVIAAEEKLLAATFGDVFTDFCRDVPRWLIKSIF
jgi:protein-S-isoprenylcysteine O-methyltransferase Ste14